jgi:hypothetical protein
MTLAVGLALTGLAVFAVLQHSPLIAAGSNGVEASTELGVVQGAGSYCQPGERLPRRISALRLSFAATTGPKIVVAVSSHRRVVTSGTIGSGWYGASVTVAVRPLRRAYSDVTVCAHFDSLTGDVDVLGEQASAAAPGAGGLVPGKLRIVYLRSSTKSWWSLAGWVIGHIALGRAPSGTWIVFAIVVLVAAAVALAALALTQELR